MQPLPANLVLLTLDQPAGSQTSLVGSFLWAQTAKEKLLNWLLQVIHGRPSRNGPGVPEAHRLQPGELGLTVGEREEPRADGDSWGPGGGWALGTGEGRCPLWQVPKSIHIIVILFWIRILNFQSQRVWGKAHFRGRGMGHCLHQAAQR